MDFIYFENGFLDLMEIGEKWKERKKHLENKRSPVFAGLQIARPNTIGFSKQSIKKIKIRKFRNLSF